MAVSTEGRSDLSARPGWSDGSTPTSIRFSVSLRLSGKKISSRVASASHLPDALIQRTPSCFSDVFPVAAWTKCGFFPRRADTSRRGPIVDGVVGALMDKGI
jgi:hypothetical protein